MSDRRADFLPVEAEKSPKYLVYFKILRQKQAEKMSQRCARRFIQWLLKWRALRAARTECVPTIESTQNCRGRFFSRHAMPRLEKHLFSSVSIISCKMAAKRPFQADNIVPNAAFSVNSRREDGTRSSSPKTKKPGAREAKPFPKRRAVKLWFRRGESNPHRFCRRSGYSVGRQRSDSSATVYSMP